jgi:acetyl esterase/lipase
MSVSESDNAGLFVPARTIPVPRTISPQAQAFLATMAAMPRSPEPAPSDKAAWRAQIAATNRMIEAMMANAPDRHPAGIVTHSLTASSLYEITPHSLSACNAKRAIFYIHGGGFTTGGGLVAAHAAIEIADLAHVRVFSIDYRMPPDHPFPAGLDDTVEAYRLMLARYSAGNIAVYGPSAGGGLAASFVLKARDSGLPLPGACVLATPECDLTESGDTFETNNTIDVVLKERLTNSILLYANGHDLADPYLSALFGDFARGFPPTVLTAGTRDLFLSNAVRMHRALRRAGVKAELHVFEAMPHGGFFGTAPEDQDVLDEHVRFMDENTGRE